jgi:hypothetical protein
MAHGAGEERSATCREALPPDHPAAVLAWEPGQRPLGLDARDGPREGTPMPLAGLPDPWWTLGADPALPEALAEIFGLSPLLCRTWSRVRGRPRVHVRPCRASRRGLPWARSSPVAGVVPVDHGMPAASVSLGLRLPRPVPPRATSSPPPLPGEKAPSTAPSCHGSSPRASATPSRRAGMTRRVPSACQRCAALLEAHGGPRGRSPQRQPVIRTSSTVLATWREGVWGMPRPRVAGAEGNGSATRFHAKSLHPSHVPAMVPSSRHSTHSSIERIFVGSVQRKEYGT